MAEKWLNKNNIRFNSDMFPRYDSTSTNYTVYNMVLEYDFSVSLCVFALVELFPFALKIMTVNCYDFFVY